MNDDVLGQLAGAPPRRVLDDLARLAAALAKHDRSRPEVELYLASGQVVKGRIVSVADDRHGAIAVIHTGGNAHQPAVAFVPVDQIAAIGVADASVLVRGAPLSDSPAPSRLELQRQLAARVVDALQARLGRMLKVELAGDLDDDARRAIGLLVPVLAEVLSAIAGDEMGRAALATIAGLTLSAAPSGEVTRDGQGLAIRAPTLLVEQFTHHALRRALEKHL